MSSYKTIKTPDTVPEPPRKRAGGPPKGSANAKKHGIYQLKRALTEVGFGGIDRRTSAGREFAARRESIYADAGGHDSLSQIRLDLIERYMRLCVVLDSLDNWLFQQPSLINKRKRCLLPIVRERAQLEDSALRLAQAIGLERKPQKIDIVGALAEMTREDEASDE